MPGVEVVTGYTNHKLCRGMQRSSMVLHLLFMCYLLLFVLCLYHDWEQSRGYWEVIGGVWVIYLESMATTETQERKIKRWKRNSWKKKYFHNDISKIPAGPLLPCSAPHFSFPSVMYTPHICARAGQRIKKAYLHTCWGVTGPNSHTTDTPFSCKKYKWLQVIEVVVLTNLCFKQII